MNIRTLPFAFALVLLASGSTAAAGDASQATPVDAAALLERATTAAAEAEDAGDLAAAEAKLREAIERVEAEGKARGADYGIALGRLARLRTVQDGSADVGALFERAVAAAEAELGPVHARLAPLQTFLANARMEQQRDAEAEALYRRAIEGFGEAEGMRALLLAHALGGLASVHSQRGEFEQVVPLLERSMAIHESVFGEVDRILAWQMGDALMQLDQLERAATYLERAVGGASARAASQLAAIRALGPYVDPGASGPQALQALRENLAAGVEPLATAEMTLLLERRAVRQHAQDPDGNAWRTTCEAQAEVELWEMAGGEGTMREHVLRHCLERAQGR